MTDLKYIRGTDVGLGGVCPPPTPSPAAFPVAEDVWEGRAGVAVAVQGAMGVGLVAGQGVDRTQCHLCDGLVALIGVGIVDGCGQGRRTRRHVLYGCAGLCLMGVGIRAMLVTA